MVPRIKQWKIYGVLSAVVILTLFILACGAEATATPTAPPAKAAPVATATPVPAAPAATATPTAKPKPTATATPVPAKKEPAAARLLVAFNAPHSQGTVSYLVNLHDTGPTRPLAEHLYGHDPYTGETTNKSPGFGQLATGWDLSDDGYTWTYDLREGVFHHNTDTWTGTEFTASDVVFSRATLDKGEEDSHAPSGIWDKIIHEFDDSNPHQLKWTTAVVELDMYYLAGIEERGLIYSKDYWDAVGRDAFVAHPVASGPWKFKEFVVNEYMLYERNEEHWRKVPDFAELQLLYVSEDATRLAQLLAGEVHIIGIPGVLIPEAEAGGMGIGYSTRPGNADFIVVGGNYPEDHPKYDATDPLVNVDVRKALSMAIDRKLLKDTFFGDRASFMPAPLLMAGRDPINPDWPVPYTYDVAQAKELLAGAGYPDGFDMTLMCFKAESAVPEHEDMGEAVADMWEQIGVNVTFTPKERLHINAQGYDFGMGRHAWIATVVAGWTVSSQWPWTSDYPKGNAYYFYDAYLDEIFPDLGVAVSLEMRDPVILKYGNRMMENFNRLPLFWLHPAVAFDPAVVVDYSVNMSAFGPTMWHEYTEVVLK